MDHQRKSLRVGQKLAPLAAAAAIAGVAGGGIVAATTGSTPSATAATAGTTAQQIAVTESSITSIYRKVSAGVVDITVSGSSGGNRFGGQSESEGSGFVLDTAGHIVTAEHVIEGATSITVHLQNGKSVQATVVGSDASSDIAVLKADVSASELTPIALGSSSTVDVGQAVIAVGSPFGLSESVTAGIVSAVGRQIQAPDGYTITGAIQTDAAINPGNSGGPLLDASGQVIGVNDQIDSSSGGNEGVGFAVPIDTVKTVAAQLISGGKVAHAYLGVQVADADGGAGAKVTAVVSGSPAADAGAKVGDVVTAVDATAIRSADELTTAIAGDRPGDRITLTVSRSGSVVTLTATLGTRSS